MTVPPINFDDPTEVKKFVESASFGVVEVTVSKAPPVYDTPIGWLAVGQCFEDPGRLVYVKVELPEGLVPVGKVACLNARDWTIVFMDHDTNSRPVLSAKFLIHAHEETP